MADQLPAGLNPYVGPRTFTRADRSRFFGREREARELLSLVISQRLVLFYAQSGAGKSSLINTRLAPQLADEGFAVLPIARVGGELPPGVSAVDNVFIFNLMLSLDQAEGAHSGGGRDPNRLAHVSLADFLARLTSDDGEHFTYDETLEAGAASATPDAPATGLPAADEEYAEPNYVLIIDQFEEIFTSHPDRWEDRGAFFAQLDAAMRADRRLWVVLTLREDYVAALDPYAPLLTDKLRARYYMQRMGIEAALEAITRPAALSGRPFAEGVAEQLVDNLRQVRVPGQEATIAGQYVEPVQLQVVCYQLWENIMERPPGPITADDVREAGDVNRALTLFYEDTLAAVLADPAVQRAGISERQLRTWFDQKLITEAGTRGLVRQGKEETADLSNAAVTALQSRFLVRAEARSGDTWIEMVHDRFVEPIRESNRIWFARNLNPLTQAAQAWREAGREQARLYAGSQLTAAAAQLQAHPEEFGELEQEFVEEGQKAAVRRAARRQRAITWSAALLALVFVALAGWALWSRGQARTAAQRAATAEAEAVDQALLAQDARDTAIFAQGREKVARSQAEANAATAVAEKARAEAASTKAVASAGTAEAERVIAQAANTAAAGALATQAASLSAALTAQAPTSAAAQPTPTATAGPLVTQAADLSAVLTAQARASATAQPMPTATPLGLRTLTPPPAGTPTSNQTVAAQQTQLAQVRATQTALAKSPTTPRAPTSQPVAWPPSGRIVFVSNRDNSRGDLYLMRGDGEGVSRLTDTTAYEPSYTEANGGQLVFTSKPGERVSIYRRSISGGPAINLTGFDSDNWEPAFSKNGQRIAFVSSRDNLDWEIYAMNSDGAGMTRLTSDDPARNTMPAWSPDGRRIAFVTVEGCGRPTCPSAIRVMASDGTNVNRLVYFEGKTAAHPAWSPDGRLIAFASDRDGGVDIFVVNADGTNLRNLTRSSSDENFPAWSLDGRWIAFTRYTDNTEIFVMTAEGARVTQITNNPASDWYPVWVR